jgi:hypothetical protein
MVEQVRVLKALAVTQLTSIDQYIHALPLTSDTGNSASTSPRHRGVNAKLQDITESPLTTHLTFVHLPRLQVSNVILVQRLRGASIVPNPTPLLPDLNAGICRQPGGARLDHAVKAVLELTGRVHVSVADAHLARGWVRNVQKNALQIDVYKRCIESGVITQGQIR